MSAAGAAGEGTVRATNTETGLTRSVATNATGDYSLGGLPPGTYKIDATVDGQTVSEVVTLRVGQVATLDLGVEAAAAEPIDSVTVVATQLYETRTSEVATYISPRQIEMLPQNSRNFLAFADTVPGVQFATSTDGSTEIRSGAQSANGVNVFIDGVGQKNYVLRGGVSGQTLTRGNPFPQLAIGEYKVITSNYKAEFDQLSSAAIVAATRSGTNEFEVEGFWDKTSEDWRASDPLEARAGRKAKSEQEQFGAAIGGPIMQDRMHFFLTYEAKEFETPNTVRLGRGVTPTGQLVELVGTSSSPFEEDLFFGKIDWAPGEAHLFELTAKIRDESEITNFGDESAASFASTKDNEESRWDLRYQYAGLAFLNDLHLTYEDASFNPRPVTLGPGLRITTSNPNELIVQFGGGRDYQDKGQKGWGVQNDVTFDAIEGLGPHIIKTGVKYKKIEINAFEQQPFNPQFSFDFGASLEIPYQVQFGAPIPGLPERNVMSRNEQIGVYVQDDWEVNEHLLLNLGVRYDYEETPSYLDHVTPADVLAGLNTVVPDAPTPGMTYAQTLALGGVNVNDYISTGDNRDAFDGAIQPRIGFSYDLAADEQHVIFGGAGRAYDRNVFDYLSLERAKGTFPTYTRFFNSPGHPCAVGVDENCLEWTEAYFDQAALEALVASNPSIGREVNLIHNDLKTPYSDQFTLGMRNRVGVLDQEWNTSVALSYIESDDGIVFLLGNRFPNGAFRNDPMFPNATWGSQPFGNGIPGLGTLIIAENGLKTRATAVLMSADKPYTRDSGWGVTLAYTYTDATENRTNVAANDEHYMLDYPDVSGFGWHAAAGVPKHRFVSTAIVDAPWDMTFSAKLTLASPFYYEALNCNDVPDDSFCFFQPFKSDTTFGTRQFDVAMQKDFNAWSDLTLRVRADVLNVFNYANPNRYETWRGGPSEPRNPAFGDATAYAQPTRTFKLSFAFNW